MAHLHIDQRGDGPRALFVHGSISGGAATWKAQYPLADRWTLLVIDDNYSRLSAEVIVVDQTESQKAERATLAMSRGRSENGRDDNSKPA